MSAHRDIIWTYDEDGDILYISFNLPNLPSPIVSWQCESPGDDTLKVDLGHQRFLA